MPEALVAKKVKSKCNHNYKGFEIIKEKNIIEDSSIQIDT
jgi:hypothetical protein